MFLLFTFFLEFETKKHVGWGRGEVGGRRGANPTIQTQNFTKLICFYFYKGKKIHFT
jgi:hypothetical protein